MSSPKKPDVVLTPRERDILRGLMRGLSNRDIAAALGLREKTIRNQLTVLYDKLNVSGRLQLALLAAVLFADLAAEHDAPDRKGSRDG